MMLLVSDKLGNFFVAPAKAGAYPEMRPFPLVGLDPSLRWDDEACIFALEGKF